MVSLQPVRRRTISHSDSTWWAVWRRFKNGREKAPSHGADAPIQEASDRRRAPTREEAHRTLVRDLQNLPSSGRARVVLIANAIHGEGASSVAQDLAAALVQLQEGRVLLVDANVRSPSQHTALGVEPGPGLADFGSGIPEAERRGWSELDTGFAVLPAGLTPGDPAQLLSERVLKNAFVELRASFDWIIVDGPPVTIYSEASTLSSLADGTILVLRAESTRSEVAERAARIVTEAGGRLLGGVINRRKYHIPDFIYKHL